jgi:hypothetical protein
VSCHAHNYAQTIKRICGEASDGKKRLGALVSFTEKEQSTDFCGTAKAFSARRPGWRIDGF